MITLTIKNLIAKSQVVTFTSWCFVHFQGKGSLM
jgi:hypothetical protein